MLFFFFFLRTIVLFVEFIHLNNNGNVQWTSCCERSAERGISCDFVISLIFGYIIIIYGIQLTLFKEVLINHTYVRFYFSIQLGYELDDEKLNDVFSRFRDLTKHKKVFNFYFVSSPAHALWTYGLTYKFHYIRMR